MRITKFDIWLATLAYKHPVRWRSVSEDRGEYVILRVCTDEGLYGLGEVADKPTWTGSTTRLTAQALRELYEPLLRGADPLAGERTWASVNTIGGWGSPKVILDLALTDLVARAAGMPLWKFLGGWTDEIPVAWLVNLGPYDAQLAEAVAAVEAHGFQALKVKIGLDAHQDVEFVTRLRQTFGPHMAIAVDANSQYTMHEALHVADGLRSAGVMLFEDPCPLVPGPLAAQLLSQSPVPIMVDARAGDLEHARSFLQNGAGAIALKMGRTGYRRSEEIRRACEAAGAGAGVGIYAESGLGSLLGLHFHGSRRHLQSIAAENCFFLKIADDVLTEPIRVVDGKVLLSAGPGLGVELDEQRLNSCSEAV